MNEQRDEEVTTPAATPASPSHIRERVEATRPPRRWRGPAAFIVLALAIGGGYLAWRQLNTNQQTLAAHVQALSDEIDKTRADLAAANRRLESDAQSRFDQLERAVADVGLDMASTE